MKWMSFPLHRKICFQELLLSMGRNTTSGDCYDGWIELGLCAVTHHAERDKLMFGIPRLLKESKERFEEVCEAVRTGRLADLLRAHNFEIPPLAAEVLSNYRARHSPVWLLKQAVMYPGMPPISQDTNKLMQYMRPQTEVKNLYGFSRCRTEEDKTLLTEVYNKFSLSLDEEANPLELHEACLRGETAQFVGRFVNLKPKKHLEKLMRNKYTR